MNNSNGSMLDGQYFHQQSSSKIFLEDENLLGNLQSTDFPQELESPNVRNSYKQNLKSKLFGSKKFSEPTNLRSSSVGGSTVVLHAERPSVMTNETFQQRPSIPMEKTIKSQNLAIPSSFENLSRQQDFYDFVQSSQKGCQDLHTCYLSFLSYLQSLFQAENNNVEFISDKKSKTTNIKHGLLSDLKKKHELQAVLVESLIKQCQMQKKDIDEIIYEKQQLEQQMLLLAEQANQLMQQNEQLKDELTKQQSLEKIIAEENEKYNLPRADLNQSTDISKLQGEIQNLQKILDMYQQNHGTNMCVQSQNLMGINGLAQKILGVCQKTEKEYVQKLKESSRNPLMKMSENGDSSSSSSEEEDLNCSDKKPPSHSRKNSINSNDLTTAGGQISKVEKDLNKILKKLKIITKYQQKLKEQKDNLQVSIENSELLDLKTEICSLKSKLLGQDQKRIQEVTQKNLQIAQLEKKFKKEQEARIFDSDTKQKIIEELEKDIEITLQSQIQENDKLKQRNQDLVNSMKNYEFWRKDLELMFMERNVSLEKGKQDSFNQSIRSTSDEVHLKKLLDKNLEIMLEHFENDQGQQIQSLQQEKTQIQQKFEQDVKSYKDKLNSQVRTLQSQMDANLKQNQDLQDQCMRLRNDKNQFLNNINEIEEKNSQMENLLIHTHQVVSGQKVKIRDFFKFQDNFLEHLDNLLEKSKLKSSRNSILTDPKLFDLFTEVLANIKNLNFIQQNPNGNVQFVIAQLGPILQKISDQLNPVEIKIVSKKQKNHSRSRSLDEDMKYEKPKQPDNFSRFCLSLISHLKVHLRENKAPSAPSQGPQVQILSQQLVLAQKIVFLRGIEMTDAIQHIIAELDGHLENLKGDYLIQIIKRIKKLQSKVKLCDQSQFCAFTRDMSKNHLLEVCQEIMKTFATLLKQLQGTQKQMIKLQKRQKDLELAANLRPTSRAGSQNGPIDPAFQVQSNRSGMLPPSGGTSSKQGLNSMRSGNKSPQTTQLSHQLSQQSFQLHQGHMLFDDTQQQYIESQEPALKTADFNRKQVQSTISYKESNQYLNQSINNNHKRNKSNNDPSKSIQHIRGGYNSSALSGLSNNFSNYK